MQPGSIRTLEDAVRWLKFTCESGVYMGLIRHAIDRAYFQSCSVLLAELGITIIYTRDKGHHGNGWWKNPDYDKCYHLSIGFRDVETNEPLPFNKEKGYEIAKMFFGDDVKLTWFESAFTGVGKKFEICHYRLFVDPTWQPIKPTGEVYSKLKTPASWKSFSEIHGDKAKDFDPPLGVA